jgi:hypothetical protein
MMGLKFGLWLWNEETPVPDRTGTGLPRAPFNRGGGGIPEWAQKEAS